jgi:hypothetical protein
MRTKLHPRLLYGQKAATGGSYVTAACRVYDKDYFQPKADAPRTAASAPERLD